MSLPPTGNIPSHPTKPDTPKNQQVGDGWRPPARPLLALGSLFAILSVATMYSTYNAAKQYATSAKLHQIALQNFKNPVVGILLLPYVVSAGGLSGLAVHEAIADKPFCTRNTPGSGQP